MSFKALFLVAFSFCGIAIPAEDSDNSADIAKEVQADIADFIFEETNRESQLKLVGYLHLNRLSAQN